MTSTVSTPPRAETRIYRRMLLDKKKAILQALGVKADLLALNDRIRDEDQAQHSLEEFVSLRLSGLEYLQLRAVEEALHRMEAGDYGVCRSCHEPIPAKRLHAIPWALYCVRCQERIADAPYRETLQLPCDDEGEDSYGSPEI
ncbi:MAG: TraR/DksA family transcriptional regulator [Acidobacteria bacterium]|nr:TraR/DksA family transcriptional regulator [Acidobacteriota bacterium]MBI3471247.1 TraR/DksA family transcriptional regulator [Candidatus Solibacter usitatus]